MNKFEARGKEIRELAKTHVLQFMQRESECQANKKGLKLAQIFRMCGLDWGEYENSTSSNQQHWVVALVRELESEGALERDIRTKHWRLKQYITKCLNSFRQKAASTRPLTRRFSSTLGFDITPQNVR